MSIRQKIDEHANALTIVCVLIVLSVVGFFVYPLIREKLHPPPPPVTNAYFFDMSSGELVVGPINGASPMSRPGQTGEAACVRAYVFSCTDCKDESSLFVGYLLKFSDEYKKLFDASPEQVRSLVHMPSTFSVDGRSLPSVERKPAADAKASTKPVPGPMGADRIRVAEAPPKGLKPQWKLPGPQESASLMKKVKDHCGQMPKTCSPPATAK